jgi:hypothetical protein
MQQSMRCTHSAASSEEAVVQSRKALHTRLFMHCRLRFFCHRLVPVDLGAITLMHASADLCPSKNATPMASRATQLQVAQQEIRP